LRIVVYYPYILKELCHRHHRTLVNVLGIAVGIALFVSINATSTAYRKAVSQPFKNLGADLVVQRTTERNATSGQPSRSMLGIRLPFSNQLLSSKDLEGLNSIKGVDSTAYSLLLWDFAPRGFRTIMGVDVEHPGLGPVKVKDWLKQGRFPEMKGELVLEKHYAKFQRVHVGDTFKISDRPFRVVGLLEIREGSQIAAANIYLTLEGAQSLLEEGANAVNMVYLRLKNPSMLNGVKSEISKRIKGLSISSSDSFLELMGGVSMISDRFSLIASLIALMGAVLLIIKTMLSNLLERAREIGILKAVGWSHGEIQKQLMGEALVQSFVGGLLGILIGYLISYGLGFLSISIPIPWDLNPLPAMAKQAEAAAHVVRLPVGLSLGLAAMSMALAIMGGCVTGYILGRRTTKMKPADILRRL
jgi:ABC-type antimicrobial peptide transport system permease subunit